MAVDELSKRKWLLDRMPLWLEEAAYHKTHAEALRHPEVVIWRADEAPR